jgi:hypothetical protein
VADRPMQPLHLRSDEDLGRALEAFAVEIAWPSAVPGDGGPDIAALVAVRLTEASVARRRPWPGVAWPRWTSRPATRALVLALVVLLMLAALVGAAGLGLPGLRIIFGEPEPSPAATAIPSASAGGAVLSPSPSVALPSPSPTPIPGPPGAGIGLGSQVDPSAVDGLAGFRVVRPPETTVGAPDAAWIDADRNDQVALVWATSDRLPQTDSPGIGLIEMAFRGKIDEGYFKKIIGAGTKVEFVEVNGNRGFWISGDPHQFFYEGPNGFVDEPRRWVGDALLWSEGPITYRLETSLGRDASIALAESMR